MRICVLHPSYEGSNSPLDGIDPACQPEHYVRHRDDLVFTSVFIFKARAVQQIRDLVRSRQHDVFLNLCDGAWDEDRAGIEVVRALEFFGVPFTGADTRFYEPSKDAMKRVAISEGVPTPGFCFAFDAEDIERAAEALPMPVIVKHFNGYGSVGMTRDSLCEDASALRREATRIIETFGGALIEVFIDGGEASVLVVEDPKTPGTPIALRPIQYPLPRRRDVQALRPQVAGIPRHEVVPRDRRGARRGPRGRRHQDLQSAGRRLLRAL